MNAPVTNHQPKTLPEMSAPKHVLERDDTLTTLCSLIANGSAAIVPIGFRCHTSMQIKKKFGINQLSLPFDSGFFPPQSIASLLNGERVDLQSGGHGTSHKVCVKLEKNTHPNWGKGIRFETTSYDVINDIVSLPDQLGINKYLDSTFGYYTFDCRHRYVLAHYNWHKFADEKKSGGITDPDTNLRIASELLNRRIERLLKICESASRILFVHYEAQGYKYMEVDNDQFALNDFSMLHEVCNVRFGNKFRIMDLAKVTSSEDLISALR